MVITLEQELEDALNKAAEHSGHDTAVQVNKRLPFRGHIAKIFAWNVTAAEAPSPRRPYRSASLGHSIGV